MTPSTQTGVDGNWELTTARQLKVDRRSGEAMAYMGADSPRAFFASFLSYTLAEGIAEQITCPTLVCEAAGDIFFEARRDCCASISNARR